MDSNCYSVATAGKRKLSFVLSGCVCFLAYEWKADISYIKCRNYVYRNRGWICRRNGISGRYFKSFKEKWNRKVAVIVPSVLFGMVHILGMDFSIGSCLQVLVAGTMAGIMFSMIAIESGSVWNSGIVHAIWNIVMIGGGLAIGQKADQFSVMTYVLDAKSFAVTGGEFGMEASVISLVGYIIVTGVAFFGNKELCDIIYKKE